MCHTTESLYLSLMFAHSESRRLIPAKNDAITAEELQTIQRMIKVLSWGI